VCFYVLFGNRVINLGFPEPGYQDNLAVFAFSAPPIRCFYALTLCALQIVITCMITSSKPRFGLCENPHFRVWSFLRIFNANDIYSKPKWTKKLIMCSRYFVTS